jgi:hypothetical protein
MTQPKQVLIMTNTILPYVRLKKKELLTLRKAALFMIRHERRSRWTKAELDEFHKRFVIPLKKGRNLGDHLNTKSHSPKIKNERDFQGSQLRTLRHACILIGSQTHIH